MEEILDIFDVSYVGDLFGNCDENINLIKKRCCVDIVIRENKLKIKGDEKQIYFAKKIIEYILENLKKGEILNKQNIEFIIDCFENGNFYVLSSSFKKKICITYQKKPVFTKTFAQKKYFDLIKNNTITFGIGPAGTGKTYIAVANAVSFFKEKEIEKIVLTRPVVEAGERLGFLPGDLQSKIDPYLRPLYDIMEEIIGIETLNKYLDRKKIEIVPLAYMRGRTLNRSFIILDEAQNTTAMQMKMFLTRLGNCSKMVITGDITQIDLDSKKECGLLSAMAILKNIEGIEIFEFEKKDVVRHEIVQKIIEAYEEKK